MSYPYLKSASTSLMLSLLLMVGGAHGQAQQPGTATSAKPEMKVGHVDHGRAMAGLLESAQKLREAVQQMARQEPGPKRDAAIEAAKEALLVTQRAMLQLPPDLRVEDVKVREAKDWPKAMARLDAAARGLRESVDIMSKQQAGKGRDDAISAMKKALAETQQAMLAIPEYETKK